MEYKSEQDSCKYKDKHSIQTQARKLNDKRQTCRLNMTTIQHGTSMSSHTPLCNIHTYIISFIICTPLSNYCPLTMLFLSHWKNHASLCSEDRSVRPAGRRNNFNVRLFVCFSRRVRKRCLSNFAW